MIMLGWLTLIVLFAALLLATVRDVRRQMKQPPALESGPGESRFGSADIPSIVPSDMEKTVEK